MTEFGGADIVDKLEIDSSKGKGRVHQSKANFPTHIIVASSESSKDEIAGIRKTVAQQQMSDRGLKVPHIVSIEWIEQSWKEKTLLDEESKFCPLFRDKCDGC